MKSLLRYVPSWFLATILLFGVGCSAAQAQRVNDVDLSSAKDRIAAVVNDSVITTRDLENRLKLAMISANLPDSGEVRERLTPQILRGLIDEQLQLDEAKRLDITISDADIDGALAKITRENNLPTDIKEYVTQNGGSVASLAQQIRAGIAWNKVVQRELRPRVDVGDDEVEASVQRLRQNVGKQEYLVSEIFLAVDSPKDEERVREFVENIEVQIKNGGNFSAVARQFSQSSSAATGGDIGWVREGQLAPDLDRVLTSLPVYQISDPIRSTNGYHILGLRDKRIASIGGGDQKTITLKLQQVFHTYSSDSNKKDLLLEADTIRAAVQSCRNLSSTVEKRFPDWNWQDYGEIDLDKTPAWLGDKVSGIPAGGSTVPLSTDKGVLVFFVCQRSGEDSINRESIINMLGGEKLELQARRLLRDLRRNAYLDIRLFDAPS